jgi:transcriptional repressor of cell division inhibition gene dicB
MIECDMRKSTALTLLGGTPSSAAKRIGITPQAVSGWPDDLPPAIADRVQAAVARDLLPPETLGLEAAADSSASGDPAAAACAQGG